MSTVATKRKTTPVQRRTLREPMTVEIFVDGKPLENTSPLGSVSEQPCWILLTAKLPTCVSPPKLSIFWSQPWPFEEFINRKNAIRADLEGKGWRGDELEAETRRKYDAHWGEFGPALRGRNPDYLNARQISFDGESIRVWPHEFSILTAEKMHYYVVESGAYAIMPEGVGGLGSTAKLISSKRIRMRAASNADQPVKVETPIERARGR